jgi:hypothetical protein
MERRALQIIIINQFPLRNRFPLLNWFECWNKQQTATSPPTHLTLAIQGNARLQYCPFKFLSLLFRNIASGARKQKISQERVEVIEKRKNVLHQTNMWIPPLCPLLSPLHVCTITTLNSLPPTKRSQAFNTRLLTSDKQFLCECIAHSYLLELHLHVLNLRYCKPLQPFLWRRFKPGQIDIGC